MIGRIFDGRVDITDKFFDNLEQYKYYNPVLLKDGNWHLWYSSSPTNYATIEDYVFKNNPLWTFCRAVDGQVWYDNVYMGQRVICTNPEMTRFWVVFNQHTMEVNDHISVKFKHDLHREIWKNANHRLH